MPLLSGVHRLAGLPAPAYVVNVGRGSTVDQWRRWDLQVEVAEPDDAVAATQQPGQTCFPLPKDNEDLVTAINQDFAELRDNGRLVEILEDHGIDASAADVGEPRLI